MTIGYRCLRFLNKHVAATSEHLKDGALRILANKYTIHAVVIFVALFVTTTNIYASDAPTPIGIPNEQSILSTIIDDGQEELLLEEAVQDGAPSANEDFTYLGAQALSMQAAEIDPEQAYYNGTDDGAYADDDISGSDQYSGESPLANAVRNQPQTAYDSLPTRTKIEEHVVQPGETLGTIAQAYGISVSTLLASNKTGNLIHPGDKLKILPVNGIPYVVKKGDTLSKIASAYMSDPQRILEMNGLSDSSALSVGDELILPDGKLPPPPRPKPSLATNIRNIIVPPSSSQKSADRFIWPAGVRRITQYYGAWRARVRHTGIDIAGPTGTAIYAADGGVVISSGWNTGGYGNMIIIDHGDGWFSRYGHASKNLVGVGDTVARGQVIALMGSTGRSTGPHLHFEIMTGNTSNRINPLGYIR